MTTKTLTSTVKHTTVIKGTTLSKALATLTVELIPSSPFEEGDYWSDKLTVISASPESKFTFVTGDKVVFKKISSDVNASVEVSPVITISKTSYEAYDFYAPASFHRDNITSDATWFAVTMYCFPAEYTGDRYYSGTSTSMLKRLSSRKFCKRLIHAGSELAPAGIQDQYSFLHDCGELRPGVARQEFIIPETFDDLSGLFDNCATIGGPAAVEVNGVPLGNETVFITKGKPKVMHRTFNNAFAYGMFTYSVIDVAFGLMDVSEVTDFSWCFGQSMQVNPDIENWNVSNATNMDYMFAIVVDFTTDKWTRDLSKWCVPKILTEPVGFTQQHPMSAAQKPVWGTCPTRT